MFFNCFFQLFFMNCKKRKKLTIKVEIHKFSNILLFEFGICTMSLFFFEWRWLNFLCKYGQIYKKMEVKKNGGYLIFRDTLLDTKFH